ncbi:MAG: TRAP transporter large permease subunit [Proteobacteria bacterium]|nr:TRAP transporter large permease subunit [Pseudomonadota bacterium]MBU4278242.1 TRAP transporter large permease subunit [Pseudomonadota bacterium]MBU4381633.1 TRAP transporter large permease subunit [Pseudomonadota bacterium]MBU4605759.1 TRAP transporter large permease subunit [Pseudomonadota bacterium]MCG2766620.1 TRAP transporter large permease subunit [Desulfarculaceae bacterium]
MDTALFTVIITGLLLLFLVLGLPVAFSLGGIAVLGVVYIWGAKGMYMVAQTAYSEGTNSILTAVPLFILMANVLRTSNLADELYHMIHVWMGRLPGGLAAGTVVICAIFAAMAGISSVATVSMGLIALPAMLKRGYDKHIATGCISAGGALGILIPPSIIMIIYGTMAEVSVGKLFMGGLVPGILLALIFCVYILIRSALKPSLGPPVDEVFSLRQKILALKGIVLPAALIIVVLGVIYTGAATPTEAAGIGAIGSLLCAAIQRRLSWASLKDALSSTFSLTAMVLWIVIGAVAFTHVLAYAGVSDLIKDTILGMQLSKWWVFIGIQLCFFVLGMFLDPAGIIMLTTPIFVPLITELGFDPIWFGVIFTINMEMAYITPPFGFNLFIMKAVVPKDVTLNDIYRSIIPFVILQALCLLIVTIFPDLALFLPNFME